MLPQPLTVATNEGSDRSAQLAQLRAWLLLSTALVIWLLLTVSGLLWLNTWRKTSYIPPPAQLISKRGIVLYQGPRDVRPLSISEGTPLDEGGVIDVPVSSEAVVQIGVDGSVIRLRPSSRLKLTSMRVGRFNRDLTQVQLEQIAGALTYRIVGDLPDGREVELRTPQTAASQEGVKLTKGEYLVWVQPGVTRITSYIGQAKVDVGSRTYRLRDSRWVAFGPDIVEMRQPLDLPEQLVRNRDFSRDLGEFWSPIEIGEKGRPDVGGSRLLVEESVDGRPMRTLRVVRETAKDTHNETGLKQEINRDVSAYRGLTLNAWVKVNSASLDGGGYAGSEYPVIIRVNYVAENGGDYTWARGFYVSNDSNRPVDIGEQLPAGVWRRVTVDMTSLPNRPAYIGSIEVVGSGHDYDGQAADIQLAVE